MSDNSRPIFARRGARRKAQRCPERVVSRIQAGTGLYDGGRVADVVLMAAARKYFMVCTFRLSPDLGRRSRGGRASERRETPAYPTARFAARAFIIRAAIDSRPIASPRACRLRLIFRDRMTARYIRIVSRDVEHREMAFFHEDKCHFSCTR